jgi:histidinol dehydrogenase
VSIVAQIKESGDEAVSRWAVELDGVEPARAQPTE